MYVLSLQGSSRNLLSRLVLSEAGQISAQLAGHLQAIFSPRASATLDYDLRVLVHVHCGDATDISTLGGHAYLAWHQLVSPAGAIRVNPFMASRMILDTIRDEFALHRLRCDFFTDGYQRTRELLRTGSEGRFSLSKGEVDLLEHAIDVHEQIALAMTSGEGINRHIGESMDSLVELLDCALQADLIILTSNQRMLGKFLAALGERSKCPAILLMESDVEPVNYRCISGLSEKHAMLIGLSEHGNSIAPLLAFLRSKHGGSPHRIPATLLESHGKGVYCPAEVREMAVTLEKRGDFDSAAELYAWLATLSDGDAAAYAGQLRCNGASRDSAQLVDLKEKHAAAIERGKTRAINQAKSLISLGCYDQADETIKEAEQQYGRWPRLEQMIQLLSIQFRSANNDSRRATSPTADNAEPDNPLAASSVRR